MADVKPTLLPTKLLVWLLILIGVFLRLRYFDLMEFKFDEVTAISITKYWLGRGIPQFGPMSGVGILNPPGFIYLLSPLLLVTSSPLWIGFYITCFNIAALWLLYRLGVKIGSSFAGFWACGFMAVHPWLILYSRKIWAQSLLPFFIIVFLIVIVQCTQEPRSRKIFWTGPLVSLIWQIHYSGYCVLIFFLIWFLVMAVKKRVCWSAVLVGFFLGIVLLSPYLFYLTQTGFSGLYQTLWGRVGRGIPWEMNLFKLIKLFGETSFAGGFGYPFFHQTLSISKTPLGVEKPWLPPLATISTILVLVFFITGVLGGKRPQKVSSTSSPIAPSPVSWLILFALLPVFLYLVKGVEAYPHYFIVSLPAVLMLSGWGIRKLTSFFRERRRYLSLLPLLMGILILLSGVVIWLSFINHINRTGGTAGDYGMAYRYMKSGAERLIEERVRPDQIDARLTQHNSIGIFYLLKNQLPSKATYLNKKARLIDSLLFPDQDCLPGEKVLTSPDLGPLKIYLLPRDEEIKP